MTETTLGQFAAGQEDERAVEHREAALRYIAGREKRFNGLEDAIGLALVHALLAVEARIEELTVQVASR